MGLNFLAFVGMWALMMTAMMLPASIGLATQAGPRSLDASVFLVGYLLVWAATGVPIFEAAVAAGRLSQGHPAGATATAVVLFVLAGVYQLSVPKSRCLERCRLRLSARGPRGKALGQGVGHGGWCVACSWATMALLIAAGVMNLLAMVVISLVLYAERHLFPGRAFRALAGFGFILFALVVALYPDAAPGLHGITTMSHM
jgi:predicted metal-binding membrane protein